MLQAATALLTETRSNDFVTLLAVLNASSAVIQSAVFFVFWLNLYYDLSKWNGGLMLNPLSPTHEWPRQNFSLQYQYNINQISDEVKEKYQFGDIISWSNTKLSQLTI